MFAARTNHHSRALVVMGTGSGSKEQRRQYYCMYLIHVIQQTGRFIKKDRQSSESRLDDVTGRTHQQSCATFNKSNTKIIHYLRSYSYTCPKNLLRHLNTMRNVSCCSKTVLLALNEIMLAALQRIVRNFLFPVL